MLDSAQQALDASVEEDAWEEKYHLAGGIFTKRQLLELELRHIVGPAFPLRKARRDREPA
jgi:hypothetical protein